MTNNTEQRRAFEEWFYDLFPMGIDDKTEALMLKSWQAALSQREQEAPSLYDIPDNELPGMWERADFEGGKPDVVRGPAPPLCTAEEAWQLAVVVIGEDEWAKVELLEIELADIINADRAKR
jgi:hypothetical protein